VKLAGIMDVLTKLYCEYVNFNEMSITSFQ